MIKQDIDESKKRIAKGFPVGEVIPRVLGGTFADGGLWRLFGMHEPKLMGYSAWNAFNLWKSAWAGLDLPNFFGEDIFGNQLFLNGSGVLFLWNHEDATITDTGLDLLLILDVSIENGLGWMDVYNDGSYELAIECKKNIPIESHLHLVHPKILGGQTTVANVSLVERVQHLVSHAQLWDQIRLLPEGARVIPRTTNGLT